jgi:hypothetical protein
LTDDQTYEISTGGPDRAPRSVLWRIARALLVLAAVVGLLYAASAGLGSIPRQTQLSSLIIRGAIGLAIGLVLTFLVLRMRRAFGESAPAAPMLHDARETDVVYECPVCGMRVRLEVAATAKAPKHCGEEMEAKLVSR